MISVVVPVRNGLPWLEEQLDALTRQRCDTPWEIVVADNGSTDDSRLVAQEWTTRTDRVRLVDASRVRGPGATRNVGVAQARGELLAFCDADDVVHPGWLHAHVSALADVDLSAGVMDLWSLNGHDPPVPLRYAQPGAMGLFDFLPAAAGGNLAIRREAFEAVGGFSEELMTGEDFDLCWRAQLRGSRFALTTEAVVAVRRRQGFAAVFRRNTAYGRCGPKLFRRFRAVGLERDLTTAAKAWLWLIVMAPRLLQPQFHGRWASIAGWRTGRALESVRERVLFP